MEVKMKEPLNVNMSRAFATAKANMLLHARADPKLDKVADAVITLDDMISVHLGGLDEYTEKKFKSVVSKIKKQLEVTKKLLSSKVITQHFGNTSDEFKLFGELMDFTVRLKVAEYNAEQEFATYKESKKEFAQLVKDHKKLVSASKKSSTTLTESLTKFSNSLLSECTSALKDLEK
jgi:hypothetical protein